MRRIEIPASINIIQDNGQSELLSFDAFVCGSAVRDPVFGKNLQTIRYAVEIWRAVKSEGLISEEAWTLLVSAIENPSSPYNVLLAIQCMSFFDAITNASEETNSEGSSAW
jgi:hypothetical protein